MAYLTYEDYIEMGGLADVTAFDDLEFEARNRINWYSFNRLSKFDYKDLPEEVKRCTYHIINRLLQIQMASKFNQGSTSNADDTELTVASQSNDGVSISYNTLSASDALTFNKEEIDNIIKRDLAYTTDSLGRKVLYRGLYIGE